MLFEDSNLETKRNFPQLPLCNKCLRIGYKGQFPTCGDGKNSKTVLAIPEDIENRRALYECLVSYYQAENWKEVEEIVCKDYWVIPTNACGRPTTTLIKGIKGKTFDAAICCFPLFISKLQQLRAKKLILFIDKASDCEILNFYYGSKNYSFDQDSFSSVSPWCGRKILINDDRMTLKSIFPIISPKEIVDEENDYLRQQKLVHFTTWFKRAIEDESEVEATSIDKLLLQCKNLYDKEEIDNAFSLASNAYFSAFDFETNTLKPENPLAKISCVSFTINDQQSFCVPWNKDTAKSFKRYVQSDVPKVAANMKFEDRWCRNHPDIKTPVNNWVFDVTLALHVEDSAPNTKSLKFAAFSKLGVPFYASETEKKFEDVDANGINKIDEIPKTLLFNYCAIDSLLEAIFYKRKDELFYRHKGFKRAYKLLHEGTVALAEVEANGIRIGEKNMKFLAESELDIIQKQIPEIERKMKESVVWKTWVSTFGAKASLTSGQQFGVVLFEKMEVKNGERTKKSGQWLVDEIALSKIKDKRVTEFIKLHLQKSKLKKLSVTYINGIKSQVHNERLHPFYNMVNAVSYRSSSSSPNFQNMPIRNKETAKYIRGVFIPDEGCFLGEFDFSGIEVSMAACYHKDENMIKYLTDDSKDMHGDMGEQLYKVKKTLISKDDFKKIIRYGAKNKFVFPVFYGSYWKKTALDLWTWITSNKDVPYNGKTIGEHIKTTFPKGLGDSETVEQGSFYNHVKSVEEHFWNIRFPQYAAWKRETFDKYQQDGYLDSKTGFRYKGIHGRTQILNFPIQGSAFHMLLWSLTTINKRLKEMGMKSFISGQIHDSIISNIKINEARKFFRIAGNVMTKELLKEFPWIIVPFRVEMELVSSKGSWLNKSVVSLTDDNKLSWNGQLFATGKELNNAMNKTLTTNK